ncbi:hypothetical protein ACFVTE_24210 [Arthrobacter sp. NPDC058097]
MSATVGNLVTSGMFSLAGGTWDVDRTGHGENTIIAAERETLANVTQ